jgi:hypothetical protein
MQFCIAEIILHVLAFILSFAYGFYVLGPGVAYMHVIYIYIINNIDGQNVCFYTRICFF